LTHIDVRAVLDERGVALEAEVSTNAQTGVEMEALTAVSVAALTVYDMCKAIEKGMTITDVRLEIKSGGKSGNYARKVT
jgi:molybdenum cofactor biosynthesis protein MoaC